jgi:hypothetical protein
MQRRSGHDEATRARLFGKRAALVSCGVVAVWFIVSSVAQLIPAVFGARMVPLGGSAGGPPAASSSPEWQCAEGLRRAEAFGASSSATRPEIGSNVVSACSQTSAGLDALAAYRRLELAEAKLGSSDPGSVDELRRELSAHLPAQMR